MNNKVIKNYCFNLLYQLLIVVTPLITTPYISRVIGADGIGLYSSCYGVASMFSMFGLLGIMNYGSKKIAQVKEDKENYSKTFWSIWSIQLIASFISIISYIVLSLVMKEESIYYFLLFPLVISSMLDISWFFMGMEDLKKTVIRNTIVKIIFVISLFLFVKNVDDLKLYFLIQSSSYLLGYLVLWFPIKKYINFIPISNWVPKKHIKEILVLFIPVIAIQLTASFDRTLIKFISNKTEAGFYDQAIKMSKIVTPFLTSLSYALLPKIASLSMKNDITKISEGIKLSFDFTFFFSLLGAGILLIVAPIFVPIFFGEEFTIIIPMVQVACILIVAIPVGGVFANQLAVPLGKNVHYIIPVYITVIIDFVLIILLVPKYGALGGVIAMSVAEGVTTIVRIAVMYKTISLKYIFHEAYKYLIIVILTTGITWGIYYFIEQYFNSMILLVIISLIYLLISLGGTILLKPLIYLKSIELLKSILNKVKRKRSV